MVFFHAKFHFLLVKCHRPPRLVYNLGLGGVYESIPKNAYSINAKFYEPVILPFCQQKGPQLSPNFQKKCVTQKNLRLSELAHPFARQGSVISVV